ncbi:MAG TPA: glycoside hydrolase family 38 C-terminal domain-containing protein, partial [Gemmatimonadales bacterium]|nr:glycoside hydrolase family 38 C-terminal domain-containing protein [Gemmatimonadales bacterium]
MAIWAARARRPPLAGPGDLTGRTFHLIPHTHWDREWYLPRAAFHARLVAMVDDLLARFEANPGYRTFLLDGQTVLLEDYLRARPERETELRRLVEAGRLQVGPWYVLADEVIPSGESLIRNLLLGAADAARLGGRCDALYSPDAFGHPAILPSIAREFGLKGGVLWRGIGGEAGQEGDVYRWRGPDGKDVVIWHLPPAGYEIGAALPLERERLAAAWAPVRAALLARANTTHVAVPIGADHHSAHPDVARLRDLLAELEPASAFRISRLDEFVRDVAAAAANAPEIRGELRWSYGFTWTLQGVHGTRAPLKRRHSRAELWLERIAEPLAALARRSGGPDPRPVLDVAWRALVRSQFHDALCGCASDAVARAMAERLESVEAYAAELTGTATHSLAGYDPDAARDRASAAGGLIVWNPAARVRGGIVIADISWFRRDVLVGPPGGRSARTGDGAPPFALAAADGTVVPVQVLDRRITLERRDAARHYPDQDEVEQVRVAFRAPPIPALGCAALVAGAPGAHRPGDAVALRGRTLRNRWVDVSVDGAGALTLIDRRTGERFGGLLRLEDADDAGDTYTYCPPARDRVRRAAGPVRVRRTAAGPLVAGLDVRYRLAGVMVRLGVTLHADSPAVRCVIDLDNRATDHRLRARLPTGLAGRAATAGAPFGAVTRAPVTARARDYPLETPVRTAPAHRFVAVADEQRGLALLAPGFFEYEWTRTGDLLFTLLR